MFIRLSYHAMNKWSMGVGDTKVLEFWRKSAGPMRPQWTQGFKVIY